MGLLLQETSLEAEGMGLNSTGSQPGVGVLEKDHGACEHGACVGTDWDVLASMERL